MTESEPTVEARRALWTAGLTGFLAESYEHGWAAGAAKEKDPVTGEKTLTYENGDWRYVDKYTGYFAAPGESKVYYKDRHVWSLYYFGEGQQPEHYDEVQETFAFLKDALHAFAPSLPLRGPEVYRDQDSLWQYTFQIEGDIIKGNWKEEIIKSGNHSTEADTYFSQEGSCGIIIDKDENYHPVYPWDL